MAYFYSMQTSFSLDCHGKFYFHTFYNDTMHASLAKPCKPFKLCDTLNKIDDDITVRTELVLLREDGGGAGRVGGGAEARAGPGSCEPGAGAGSAAAADGEREHGPRDEVPDGVGQDVRERGAGLRARQGRRRGARPGVRGRPRARPLHLRREHPPPRRALPYPRQAFPGVPHTHQVRGQSKSLVIKGKTK